MLVSLKLKRFGAALLVWFALSSLADLLMVDASYGSLPAGEVNDSSLATGHRPELEYLKVLNGATNDMMGRGNSEDDGHPGKLCRRPGEFHPSLSQIRT